MEIHSNPQILYYGFNHSHPSCSFTLNGKKLFIWNYMTSDRLRQCRLAEENLHQPGCKAKQSLSTNKSSEVHEWPSGKPHSLLKPSNVSPKVSGKNSSRAFTLVLGTVPAGTCSRNKFSVHTISCSLNGF